MSGPRLYVGLAATFHDPAIALVSETGDALFAEALERPLQDKRAFNAAPDHLVRAAAVIREYGPAEGRCVAAVSWSADLLQRLRVASLCEMPGLRRLVGRGYDRLLARRDHLLLPLAGTRDLLAALSASLGHAGLNLRWHGLLAADGGRRYYDHHLAHAAGGCFSSPFPDALCAVVDAFGEWTSTAFFHYRDGRLRRLGVRRPWRLARRASLGTFYAVVCDLCGFDPLLGEEWKVMGLASYGRVDPELYGLLRPLLRVDGLELLLGCSRDEYLARVARLQTFRRPPAAPPLAAADLARTGQEVFSEVMRELLTNLHATGLSENLVLAGGCALNSSWNGRVCRETPFAALHVPCAPADDGNALGAALLAWAEDHPGERPRSGLRSPYLGSPVSAETLRSLVSEGAVGAAPANGVGVARQAAELLARGRIVGWMQGRAEFGPRALGNRSILADPRDPAMRARVNATVKLREDFRPLAPAVLDERGAEWFDPYELSPYMERTLPFRPAMRARVPAVVHVDGTGRPQSVTRESSPRFHELLTEFHALTGVPMLLNTSFNVMGKPMVHSVEDAVAAFATTGLDALVLEDVLLVKPGR
jgi:carbamoyltransferase